MIRVQIIIRIIRVIRVQQNLVFKPPVSAPPRTKIREIRAIRVLKKYSCYPSIRVQKIQSDIRVQKSRVPHVSAPPRTKIREIGEIRVPKNIRVIRVIRVQKNSW